MILLVTEKYQPEDSQRDGGARIVTTLKKSFGDKLSIMQFNGGETSSADWSFHYPIILQDRFQQRIANAGFIAEQIKRVEHQFTHVIFIHISMQFGIVNLSLRDDIIIWTFPMFLTPSYKASGEKLPNQYTNLEKLALAKSHNIITPSHFEKDQLKKDFSVAENKIHVVPRGIDVRYIIPKIRSLNTELKICSIGSIKPQKNTLELIDLFFKILQKFPKAKLKIIGPIQNEEYYIKVCKKIEALGINAESIEMTGYLSPDNLFKVTKDCHIHISRSNCETFGRSIFETLACGIPNIAKRTCNAAAEFLDDKPYVKFIDDDYEAIQEILDIIDNLEHYSSMALEVGKLYDDEILSRLLLARIWNKETIAISDFDGTLFHKEDEFRTKQSILEFKSFSLRAICTARSANDILEQLRMYNLKVDWIIAYSGAIVTDGDGNIIWSVPLKLDDKRMYEIFTQDAKKLEADNKHLQISISDDLLPNCAILHKHKLRYEIYENKAYIADIEASKLHAIHKLLKHIDWSGKVKVFGNGRYDMEMIKYFDGIKVSG